MKPYVNTDKIEFCGANMWEKPSYEIISAGAEITAYIHKR
jgi:coenzyme PQQ precursor peptide PqqA